MPQAFNYTNRMGTTYFLHGGKTKTGKPRYFFTKVVDDRALLEMPEGFEVSESINGIVSARRIPAGQRRIPDEDVALVREAVAHHRHLKDHQVQCVTGAIVVFEPDPSRAELESLVTSLTTIGGRMPSSYIQDRMGRTRYLPVVKFDPVEEGYSVRRMTYRGDGGWSFAYAHGKLAELTIKFVPRIGTDRFYDIS